MFIASQTSRWVYGCPVNWETPLRIYIITSWCKLLTISPFLPLSHLFLLLVTFNAFNIKKIQKLNTPKNFTILLWVPERQKHE